MALVPKGLKRFLLFGVLPLLLAGSIIAWVEREELLCCWYLNRLENTSGEEARPWAEKLAGLDDRAVPELIALLSRDTPVCDNARMGLDSLFRRWGRDDPRTVDLVHLVVKEFAHFSKPGQEAALGLALEWLEGEQACPACLVCALGRLLAEINHANRAELHAAGVEFALGIVTRSQQADLCCAARDIARAALQSTETGTRVRAVKLATQPGVNLRERTLPLLNDPEPLVRRAAMLAVGESPEVIHTDNLLHWLHDPDPEVRQLCEQALRGEKRGSLSPEFIRMGKLLTDPRWQVRVSVLDHLEDAEELDSGVWLDRLSRDPEPAVRAAAVRAAGENNNARLTDRLNQMAHDDPSPTVADVARYYLTQRKKPRSP